ncbi:MAG: inorganic phosphate transporter [Acidobacteriota bacterium]|nr:inorganic phosphate transporter [Acidobacteriota bacterium]MDQ5872562.1 inorganic phosphate transporter [Acidobacteriota bacterium]
MTWGLIIVLLLILGAEFVNGWTDAPNAIATVVSTRSLTPFQAVVMAAVLNLVGVFSGTAVAQTIGKGIIDPNAVDLVTVGGAMVGIILWSSVAARWGIPTSESHALVAGLAGAGIATAGPGVLVWEGWRKVLVGLVFSTFLGLIGGFLVITAIYWLFRRAVPGKVRGTFRWLQVLSSGFMAFSHGSNDGQKFMGAFTLALVLGNVLPEFAIPTWVILLCAATMALGTLTGGWRIIKTMGMRITKLEPHQGFAAEMAAATTITIASRLGIPLSTTHTISTAIVGVGAARGASAVRWGVTMELVSAWILTFPICAIISWLVVKVARTFF